MADNTTLNTGSGGDVIASDDIAGVKFQRIKLIHGADGVNDGDVSSSNRLPVTTSGTVTEASAASILTGVQLIDDTVFTDDTSTHTTAVTKGLGIMAVANPTDAAVDANDIGMVAMTLARALKNDITTIAGTSPSATNPLPTRESDGTGFIKTITLGSDRYKGVGMVQNIVASTANSSTGNIASGAAFTGTSEGSLGINTIQVNLFADQNCTIQIQQSNDGTNWDYVQGGIYKSQASIGSVIAVYAAGSFFRVIVTNNGASTTTAFRLQTILAPIGSPSVKVDAISVEGVKRATYRASTIVPLVTAVTVNRTIWNIIGSATKTVTIKRITISGVSIATAVNYVVFNLVKYSTATTGGTSSTLASVPLDALNAAATAVVKAYTAVATDGALIGTLASAKVLCPITATAAALQFGEDIVWNFSDINGSGGIVLRGVAQELAILYPVAAATVPTQAISVEWTEE